MMTANLLDLGAPPAATGLPGAPPTVATGVAAPDFLGALTGALSGLMSGTATAALVRNQAPVRQDPAAGGKSVPLPGLVQAGPVLAGDFGNRPECEVFDPTLLSMLPTVSPDTGPTDSRRPDVDQADPRLEPALAWLMPPMMVPAPASAPAETATTPGSPAAVIRTDTAMAPGVNGPPIEPDQPRPTRPLPATAAPSQTGIQDAAPVRATPDRAGRMGLPQPTAASEPSVPIAAPRKATPPTISKPALEVEADPPASPPTPNLYPGGGRGPVATGPTLDPRPPRGVGTSAQGDRLAAPVVPGRPLPVIDVPVIALNAAIPGAAAASTLPVTEIMISPMPAPAAAAAALQPATVSSVPSSTAPADGQRPTATAAPALPDTPPLGLPETRLRAAVAERLEIPPVAPPTPDRGITLAAAAVIRAAPAVAAASVEVPAAASALSLDLGQLAPVAAGAPVVQPVAAPQHAGIDPTHDHGLHRMIDRIEHLRDAFDTRETRIRLIPDALGPVDISVRRDGDGGAVQIHFTAAEAATRQLIADTQQRLTDLADSRGVRIERATVDAGSSQHGSGDGPARGQQQLPPAPPRAPPRAAGDAEPNSEDERIA